MKRALIHRRLIVARRSTGETDMFVITLVPSSDARGNIGKSLEKFRYLGGGDFTGRVFCSTLEGEFVKAFGCPWKISLKFDPNSLDKSIKNMKYFQVIGYDNLK